MPFWVISIQDQEGGEEIPPSIQESANNPIDAWLAWAGNDPFLDPTACPITVYGGPYYHFVQAEACLYAVLGM